MKTILLILLMFTTSVVFAQTNTSIEIPKGLDSLGTQVMKLMKFYDSYNDGSPESLKKANYNDAINELTGANVSKKDKEDAFQIIDAYIKGDKALEQKQTPQDKNNESFETSLKNSPEVKNAQNFIEQQKIKLQQMSYSEFEEYFQQIAPIAGKKEIKTAYNEIHKNDGKQVAITEADGEMTKAQQQMWAIETIQNPKNYNEFWKAYKTLNPNGTEVEARKIFDSQSN